MNLRHSVNRQMCSAHGFSMIDALIAIVVMATALLALAVLQGSLTRNTADAGARSQIAQYGDSLLDLARKAGYSSVASKTQTAATGANYDATTAAVQTAAGVSSLQVVTTVTNYTYANPNVPGATAACTGQFVTNMGSCPVGNSAAIYKSVTLATTWQDASGTNRTLIENTIVSPLSLDNSSPLVQRDYGNGAASTPIVRTRTPVVPGVIPIAISANTDTAATNPRPELSGVNNATSYNVLTYKNLTDVQVQIQQRIETNVIGCSCQYGQQSTTPSIFAQAWRPTYWDGTHYAEPDPAATSPAGQDANYTASHPAVVQSPLCTYCCRDHHDYAADKFDATTDVIKFDPFRTDAHTHYRWSTNPAPAKLVAVPLGDSNPYLESCRMIRVNGLWRASTDMNADQVGLLATESEADAGVAGGSILPATNWIPSTDAETNYQAFVKNYFDQKVAQGGSPNANNVFDTYGLDRPTLLTITNTPALYLNARGLYLDHLEVAAAKQIQTAKDHCTTGTTIECVLPHIPFTSINLTEIVLWGSPNGQGVDTKVQVANGSGIFGNFNGTTIPPIRGKVTTSSAGGVLVPVPDDLLINITASNSGVAGFYPAIDPVLTDGTGDATLVANWSGDPTSSPAGNAVPSHTDLQQFKVTARNGDPFSVVLIGLPQTLDSITNNDPLVAWYNPSDLTDFNDCVTSYSATNSDPSPYGCQTDVTLGALGVAMKVAVQQYNRILYKTESNPCDSNAPQVQHAYCEYSKVSSVDLNGLALAPQPTITITNTGKVAEQSMMTVPLLPKNGVVTVNFTATGETGATAQACVGSVFPGFNPPPCQ